MQPPRDEQQSPPWPSGEVLAELDRPGFRGRPDSRLVVALDAIDGNSFISMRVWQRTPMGFMVPTRAGLTVRLKEAAAVAEALRRALELAEGQGRLPMGNTGQADGMVPVGTNPRPAGMTPTGVTARPDRRQQRAERRERPWRAPEEPPAGGREGFDEFGG